jgi:hypothetical protein
LELCGTFSQYIAEVFAENPSAPLLFMGEDIGSSHGLICSPDFIRHKALPIWKRIARPIKEKRFKFLYHTDGRAKEILPIIVNEFGAEGFNPMEWLQRHLRDPAQLPRALAFRQRLLRDHAALRHTGAGGARNSGVDRKNRPQGGILIGSSSEVHDLVPVENALRMYETVQRYGRYPIKVSKHSSKQRATA